MARPQISNEKHPENTRALIMEAAIYLFARKGFDGTTVKDITERAKVNAGSISYHFAGKDSLYKECLETFGRGRLEVAQRLLQAPSSMEDLRLRLGMFIDEFMACHMEQPDIARVIHRECELDLPVAQDVFKNVFVELFKTLCQFFGTGKAKGYLRSDCDPLVMAGSLFGSILHMTRSDSIAKRFFNLTLKDADYRKQVGAQLLSQFLNGNLDCTVNRKKG